MSRDSTGTTEIGRRSLGVLGSESFGIGWITADFHCDGRIPDAKDRLMRWVRGLDITGAAKRKNQAGKSSGPVAVGERVSSILKTWNS